MDTSRHAAHSIPAGEWLATLESGTVTLSYADRCRQRARLIDDGGAPLLLDLVRPARLAHGDGLVLTDGTIMRVIAAPEQLLEVTAVDAHQLARLAWHLGSRQIPAQIVDERRLRVVQVAGLEQVLRCLDAETRPITAPFHPERGGQSTPGAIGGTL